jgi:hypothetical protein
MKAFGSLSKYASIFIEAANQVWKKQGREIRAQQQQQQHQQQPLHQQQQQQQEEHDQGDLLGG